MHAAEPLQASHLYLHKKRQRLSHPVGENVLLICAKAVAENRVQVSVVYEYVLFRPDHHKRNHKPRPDECNAYSADQLPFQWIESLVANHSRFPDNAGYSVQAI